jgi:hypothetical protein
MVTGKPTLGRIQTSCSVTIAFLVARGSTVTSQSRRHPQTALLAPLELSLAQNRLPVAWTALLERSKTWTASLNARFVRQTPLPPAPDPPLASAVVMAMRCLLQEATCAMLAHLGYTEILPFQSHVWNALLAHPPVKVCESTRIKPCQAVRCQSWQSKVSLQPARNPS